MLDERKRADIAKRIKMLEADILKAKEYLETGEHANWHKFRPLFTDKIKNEKSMPPHKDWVKNVFLPNCEKKLIEAERLLDRPK
jgi:predicted transglutaminase-like protease